ncbi:DUF4393 domain-containing protein [Skermania sp. ID1734]|uniref:Abi-alpha family protein n=1 Tax=Skermania sp. ID1734 TaxID=2597516 RepID=UPI00117C62D9|nr:Abi-alpha family protein [Skermania sp. ID1734]TSD99476.1 DUF4393 domain-containing protein [Skermania sp. ID1734]
MDRVSGPHELQPVPIKVFAQDIVRRLGYTSTRLRYMPVESLEFAGRLVPFGLLRRPIAITEEVLRQVLDVGAEDRPESEIYPGESHGDEAFTAPPDAHASVRSIVQELLDRSIRQSPGQAKEANYKRLLLQLVPDEARILHGLSDGKPRALINVGVGTLGGSADHLVGHYFSSVGSEVGVRCPEAVPDYIEHLLDLGLVETGPEDESLREQYEILQTYPEIEEAEADAKSEAAGVTNKLRLKATQIEKHTVSISQRGKSLWDYAHPDTHTFTIAEQRGEPEVDMSHDLPPEPE